MDHVANALALTSLIILRGQSGSGKTSTAQALQLRARSKTALLEQDYLRRKMLKEKDVPGGTNISLIDQTARFCLTHGYHVVLEGIFVAERYGEMLRSLIAWHPGSSYPYYFDVSLEETFRRHTTKTNAHEFGEQEMRRWFRKDDYLGSPKERIISEDSTLEDTVARILAETGI